MRDQDRDECRAVGHREAHASDALPSWIANRRKAHFACSPSRDVVAGRNPGSLSCPPINVTVYHNMSALIFEFQAKINGYCRSSSQNSHDMKRDRRIRAWRDSQEHCCNDVRPPQIGTKMPAALNETYEPDGLHD